MAERKCKTPTPKDTTDVMLERKVFNAATSLSCTECGHEYIVWFRMYDHYDFVSFCPFCGHEHDDID